MEFKLVFKKEMEQRAVEIDDLGPVRNQNNTGEERKEREYPERDPLDLIEEDKRPFVRRKLTSTCCGGFRTAYDEVTAKFINPGLLILQILIYLFFPGVILVIAQVAMDTKDDRMEACAIVAGLAFLVCGSLHGISFYMKRKEIELQAINEGMAAPKTPNLADGVSHRPRPTGAADLRPKNL